MFVFECAVLMFGHQNKIFACFVCFLFFFQHCHAVLCHTLVCYLLMNYITEHSYCGNYR